MKVKLSLLLMIAALMSATAFAQTGVAGKWVGELSAADGHGVAQSITVDLKVDGETLSGTVTEGALEPRPIAGATVSGSNVTFRTTRNLGGSDINVNWKGELKGEDLTLTREIGPAPAEGGGRGGRGGGGGAAAGAAPTAGGRGGRGGAAPAAAAPVPPVPTPQATDAPDANAAAAAGRGARGAAPAGAPAAGGQRGGRGGGAPPAAGAAPAAGGRGGGAAAAPGPTVTLTLRRSR